MSDTNVLFALQVLFMKWNKSSDYILAQPAAYFCILILAWKDTIKIDIGVITGNNILTVSQIIQAEGDRSNVDI